MTAVTLPARRATVVTLSSARKARGGHHNKGLTFPPDPITAEDMAPLLGACAPQTRGTTGDLAARRLRAMLVVLDRRQASDPRPARQGGQAAGRGGRPLVRALRQADVIEYSIGPSVGPWYRNMVLEAT